jgi:hypothetical protein
MTILVNLTNVYKLINIFPLIIMKMKDYSVVILLSLGEVAMEISTFIRKMTKLSFFHSIRIKSLKLDQTKNTKQ